MDPTSLISQTPIPEIWQFPLVGVPPNPKINGRDSCVAESTLTDHSGGSRGRLRRMDSAPPSEDESSKLVSTSSGNDATDSDAKRLKGMQSRDENGESKTEAEANSGLCSKPADQNAQPLEAPKQDYIHVRARRGQATDSHSLAERARREKISERMRILQDLVPGCNKVIGKASVLDEIINYIQALQRQVEFLSMKLEAVNSRANSGIEGFPPKDGVYGISWIKRKSSCLEPRLIILLIWHSARSPQGNTCKDPRRNGYICRSVVLLRESHKNTMESCSSPFVRNNESMYQIIRSMFLIRYDILAWSCSVYISMHR